MIKENQPRVLDVNPRIKKLQDKITASNAFNQASIEDTNIISLMNTLIKTDSVSLTGPSFDNPDNNSLQVTTVASLFSKSIKVTAVFVVDDKDNLSMTMNTFENISMLLSEIYKAGLVPSEDKPGLIPPVPVSGLSFVFDSAGSSFSLKGQGGDWDFLGYTGLKVASPALTLVSDYNDGFTTYQWLVSGTLTDNNKVNIPVAVGLPINITGWSIAAGPLNVGTDGLGIIDALTGVQVSALLPNGFTDLLEKIDVKNFFASFDPIDKSLTGVQLIVETNSPWEIVPDKLKLKEGIRLLLNAQRFGAGQPLTYNGSISGSAAVNYKDPNDEVTASASIPIPLNGADWEITLQNKEAPLGFGKLAALVPGVKGFMPDGLYDKLNEIILEFLTFKFKYDSGFSFTKIAFAINSPKEWQLPFLQEAIYLDKDFRFALDVPMPYDSKTTTGSLSGIIQIDGGNVSIPVKLAKTPEDTHWNLQVTSDEIPLPSISNLAGFMGGGVLASASPSGLMNIGDFAIYNLELIWQFGTPSKLLRFAFTISSTGDSPAWNLVPGYFELTDLFVSIAIDNRTVADKDISGSIGATVTWILNKEKDSKLVLFMMAQKPSSNEPWKFTGELKENLILKDLLLALKTPQSVVDLLPDLQVTEFKLSIEPTSGSFSINMAIEPVETWVILTIGSMDIKMENMSFAVEKYAGYLEMAAKGSFELAAGKKTSTVALEASYKNKDWNFIGNYDNSGSDPITINEVLAQYIQGIDTASIPQLTIKKVMVNMVKGTTDTNTAYNTLNFVFSGEIDILQKLLITADIDVKYDSRKTSKYDGTELKGKVEFGGLSFSAMMKYANNKFGEKKFTLTFKGISVNADIEETTDTTTFRFSLGTDDPNKQLTLGDLIAAFIEAATDQAVTIPSPWNFILNISMNNFGLLYKFDKKTNQKTVGLTWPIKLNLGFINIEEFSLLYSPGQGDKNGPVEFKITKGTFLGMTITDMPAKDRPDWDLRDPSKAPAVPGFGNSSFKLEFLGIGNQVAITQKTPPTSVTQAIGNLAAAFNVQNSDKLPPDLYFDKNYGVLVGAQFVVVKYIQIAAVFYDPVMYGLMISVKDGKFKNLYFEVLYKKVNDNVGMFQIDLTLPDFVRQQQFGAVSVTLPSISLSIYTNGDFIINMGFPKNGDFSKSFGLEFSIFTGAGGFYFGKLSNSTSTYTPQGADGQFNPVIIFGIGIRAGVGRSVNKGPLKAELSLTIQVILEGVLAWYKSNPVVKDGALVPTEQTEELYFKLTAQAALVGRVYGEIDFVIISASLDILVRIMAQLAIESYRKTIVTFSAEVYAAVTVRINLGLFKISISCSFRTGISASFTIGSDSKAPWDKNFFLASRSAYFTALDAEPIIIIPKMNWSAPLDYPQDPVNLLFIPQVSVKYDEAAANKKQAVASSLLFVKNIPQSAADTDFTVLCRGFLAWVFNAYFDAKEIKEAKILDQPVTIDDVNAIFAYFDQKEITDGTKDAFSVTDLYDYFFKQAFTKVNVTTREAQQQSKDDTVEEVAFFPIIPLLSMMVNTETPIEFSKDKPCSADYLKRIREYFAQMQVQYKEKNPQHLLRLGEPLTMAQFLFIDYFVMMAKTALQDIINGFSQTAIEAREDDSLASISKRYKHYGVTPQTLADANRHKLLKPTASLQIPAFKYKLKDNETLSSFLERFPVQENALLTADANGELTVPSFLYTPQNGDATLWTVANHFGLQYESFVALNADTPGLFSQGTRLLHAFVATKTVKEILDELQQGQAFQMANIAGTVSRFFLHGLRIPEAVTGDNRIGLYEATGQQFNLNGTIAGQTVSLAVTGGSPDWLQLGTIQDGLVFNFNTEMSNAVAELVKSGWLPGITLDAQDAVKRYRLQPKTFALATSYTWKDPNIQQGKLTLADTFIWAFPSQLQEYLFNYNNIPYQLLVQTANTPFSQTDPKIVTPLFWSTFVTVSLRLVPVEAMPGTYVENVYVVDGCGEADGQLLQQILLAGNAAITDLDILFPDNVAKENNDEQVKGLVSNALTKYSTFLLQTNYSTISNPAALGDAAEIAGSNLMGMDAKTFLTYLWECSIVRSGGYYLYYKNSTGGGLPDYVFDETGVGSVRILVSYNIPVQTDSNGYVLPAYVNSAMIDVKIDEKKDNLFAGIALTDAQKEQFNPILQTMQATILPGTGMFQGNRPNPQTMLAATITQNADQQLSELFQLLEYRIQETQNVFRQSNFALPAGPLDNNEGAENCLSRLPAPMQTETWNYGAVLPVYSFAGDTVNTDPYAANGKTATVYFNFLDVFGNILVKEGSSGITQQITPGYLDPIVGVDQWINVARSFKIANDLNNAPALTIKFEFDKLRYQQAQDPYAVAQQDLKLYNKIALQLSQAGVTASVQSSIGLITPPADGALKILQDYVAEIISFLSQVPPNVVLNDNSIIATLQYGIDPAKLNADFIFQLTVSITIERTLYIDKQFINEASVRISTTAIQPDLYTGRTDTVTPLSIFAKGLETALPVMKVAVGSSGYTTNGLENAGANDPDAKEIWLVRFAQGNNPGISFTVTPSPVYFSTKPLSTTLISRPDEKHQRPVPLRSYTPGKYLGGETPELKVFAGVDMELLSQNFISTVDTFLSAENSTKAWRIEQGGSSDYFPKPFEAVEAAKRKIAKAVADMQLTNILQAGDFSQLPAAQAAMEQQLLVQLGNMYKVNAVVQAAVNVSQGFDTATANLYGQVVFADTSIPKNTYYFTPVKVSLTKGNQAINTFFSVQSESDSIETAGIDLIDRFKAGLNIQITGLEHNFGDPINGYIPSSWLTFANPILQTGASSAPLVDADIPIPLKAYPTAPSLVGQEGTAAPAPDDGQSSKDKLENALLWNYAFKYNYVIARQDLIYLDVELNVQRGQMLGDNEEPLDLFEALMQFQHSYAAVMADLEAMNENSLIALQSFGWLVKQVADAWPVWFELQDKNVKLNKKTLKYIIKEEPEEETGRLLISVEPEKAGLQMEVVPFITIEGFETKELSFVGEKQIYYFVQSTDTSETALLFSERKKFSERGVMIKHNNVLEEENAWAGVAIHRNEILAGQLANTAFRYITPYIRFADACYPSITNQTEINIADFTQGASPTSKIKLQTLLLNFFNELLKADPKRDVMLQIQGSYSFALQQVISTIQLGPKLPIVMLPPVSVTGATISTVLEPLSQAINNWFNSHEVIGIDGTGRIGLTISLFAATSGDMHHPTLTLEGLYLPANVVDFPPK